MIVWKETKLQVRAVQARRVACSHCRTPFVYLATDTFEKVARGIPFISLVAGADGRREQVLAALDAELRTRSMSRRGEAVCPHCHHQLPWMEPGRLGAVLGIGFVLLIVGAVAAWLLGTLLGWSDQSVILYGAVGGAALGGLIGSRVDVSPQPSDNAGHRARAMTESQWQEFADAALGVGMDPAEVWWANVATRAEDRVVIGMAPADEGDGSAAAPGPAD